MLERREALKAYLSGCLSDAARAYWTGPLAAYHADPPGDDARAQALIGNLVCGCEMALKAVLTTIHPLLVFEKLPLEARCFFASPGDLPEEFHWEPYDLDLKDFVHDLIDWNKTVQTYHIYFHGQKRLLRPYFKLAGELAPLSLHASLGRVRDGETQKTVYLALQVARESAGRLGKRAYAWTEADRRFVASYESSRREKVTERLDKARQKAAALKVDITYNDPDRRAGWSEYDARCPVCKNWAVLSGWTQIFCQSGGRKEALGFFADAFDCSACGLFLDDAEELRLAGLATFHDRSEDLARWKDEPAREDDTADPD